MDDFEFVYFMRQESDDLEIEFDIHQMADIEDFWPWRKRQRQFISSLLPKDVAENVYEPFAVATWSHDSRSFKTLSGEDIHFKMDLYDRYFNYEII